MKFKTLSTILTLALFASACASAPTAPAMSGEDVQSTAMSAAFTVVAETLAAVPTTTPALPTETLAPTFTLEPSPTVDFTLLTSTLEPPTEIPTFTPQPAASGDNPCNKPLTSWNVPTASFTVVNETKPQGKVLLLMSVSTSHGECGWLPIYSDSFSGPAGMYGASAFVDGPKNFKVFGAFQIQAGSWKIVVRNDKIVALGGCYPNC
jgi:hypothetical protein